MQMRYQINKLNLCGRHFSLKLDFSMYLFKVEAAFSYTCLYIYAHLYMFMHAYMCVYMYTHVYVCIHVSCIHLLCVCTCEINAE